ncbi:MAG: methyltransferase [Candidatus Diapherotrites archaeon]|jgi:predicted methyltransferase|uniref:Methyltransferase n=1 Tax=Candidatus Iainarchaeum sp. TaxID=3101447 RepID=A0A7K4BYK1_9ARCH|nr:methyltransferase [Candidatus Diapherotrites archaeon]
MSEIIAFTKNNADFLLKEALKGREKIELSLNLGKNKQVVDIVQGFVIPKQGEKHKFALEKLQKLKENTIYTIENQKVLAVELFSKESNLYYKLRPTKDWPTLMLSSVPMHRFITSTPKLDTESKINSIKPIKGKVLDTCCGLGYTAIMLAKNGAESVTCFEKDPFVLDICKYNPYSLELFTNKKITLINENVFQGIKKLESETFDRIIHDPPTISFAKELYSVEFYKELHRVLKKDGKLYHYAPNPKKTKGAEFWKTMIKILKNAGFKNVDYYKKSSGIVAKK